MKLYELVYEDGMTHSSYNYQLIREIYQKDKHLILRINTRESTYINDNQSVQS